MLSNDRAAEFMHAARPRTYRTSFTYGILKFAVNARTLNFAFVCSMDKKQTTLSSPAVNCFLYIFLYIFLVPLIEIYFATIYFTILKSRKQSKIFCIFFKLLLFRNSTQSYSYIKKFEKVL